MFWQRWYITVPKPLKYETSGLLASMNHCRGYRRKSAHMCVAKPCLPHPPRLFLMNGGSFATAAQCTPNAPGCKLGIKPWVAGQHFFISTYWLAVIRTPSPRGPSLPVGHNGSTAPTGSTTNLGHQGLPKTSHDLYQGLYQSFVDFPTPGKVLNIPAWIWPYITWGFGTGRTTTNGHPEGEGTQISTGQLLSTRPRPKPSFRQPCSCCWNGLQPPPLTNRGQVVLWLCLFKPVLLYFLPLL